MTQHEKILYYLERNPSITPMDAFSRLGITKLATRVGEMQKLGIQFDKKMERTKDASFMRYSLKKD